jgi:hypothetical protein
MMDKVDKKLHENLKYYRFFYCYIVNRLVYKQKEDAKFWHPLVFSNTN